eukprot:m.14372 g.14372  ORF g.14372 m.14372 type:complete len:245 (+) comp25714_c0_seq1:1422-2156(+)
MGGGMSFHNDTGVEVLVVLSQVGPLHWNRVAPGETKEIDCGQVWFTVQVQLWTGSEPTTWQVLKPFVLGIGGGLVLAAGVGGVALAASEAAEVAAGAAEGAVAAEGASEAASFATALSAEVEASCGAEIAAITSETAGSTASVKFWASFLTAGGSMIAVTAVEAETAAGTPEYLQKKKEEDSKKWLAVTPSAGSADWLADNNVIAITPAKEYGVYADGKTITISSDIVKDKRGNQLMSLKLIGC